MRRAIKKAKRVEGTGASAPVRETPSKIWEGSYNKDLWPDLSTPYYKTHEGLSPWIPFHPLFWYPVEVLALSRHLWVDDNGVIWGSRKILYAATFPREEGLSNHQRYALFAEDAVRLVSKAAKSDSQDWRWRKYFRQLKVLQFMRATWDACLTGYQLVRSLSQRKQRVERFLFSSNRVRALRRWKSLLLVEPLRAAQRLKSLAGDARAAYYGGKRPSKGSMAYFNYSWQGLEWSYLARALPAAPPDPKGIEGLYDRLQSAPPPEHPGWRPFCQRYLDRWAPTKPAELFTAPSASAALGFPRAAGGHEAALKHLIFIGASVAYTDGSTEPNLNLEYGLLAKFLGSKGAEELFSPTNKDFLVKTSEVLQKMLQKGVEYTLGLFPVLPVLPIVAEEKGLKTRFPTCGLTAANLVQQILRRAADSYLRQDPRCSKSLGGDLDVRLSSEKGPWYSQDASFATDLHSQWLTQTFYEEVINRDPRLEKYRKYLPLLFGPKHLIKVGDKVSNLDFYPESMKYFLDAPQQPVGNRTFPSVSESVLPEPEPVSGPDPPIKGWQGKRSRALAMLESTNNWARLLLEAEGYRTSTGQMMGDPTSFPVLPLVSIFAMEETLKEYPYITGERIRHSRLLPDEPVIKTCGDDALLPRMTVKRRVKYDEVLTSVGVVIQNLKSFYHYSRGLFTETPYVDGQPCLHTFISTITAPPGGSKGNLGWHNQVTAVKGNPEEYIRRLPNSLWRCSPYHNLWNALFAWGIPLGAPEGYGGLNHPSYPKKSRLYQLQWLNLLATLTLSQLYVGTGLAPAEAAKGGLIDRLCRHWLDELWRDTAEVANYNNNLPPPTTKTVVFRDGRVKTITSNPQPIEPPLSWNPLDGHDNVRSSLTDSFRNSMGRYRSSEFYFRSPREGKTPSSRLFHQKFVRKLFRKRRIPGSYWNVVRDHERKLSLYLTSTHAYQAVPSSDQTKFGLESSGPIRPRLIAPTIIREA